MQQYTYYCSFPGCLYQYQRKNQVVDHMNRKHKGYLQDGIRKGPISQKYDS